MYHVGCQINWWTVIDMGLERSMHVPLRAGELSWKPRDERSESHEANFFFP